jgi:hypothetical protein
MSYTEKKEKAAIEKMISRGQSAPYRAARRMNIPVTVTRGGVIYRVTNEESVPVGKAAPSVKVKDKVIVLK